MPFRNAVLLLLMTLVAMPVALTDTQAQSAIEKSLVAKSRLHNRIWTKHDPNSSLEVDHQPWDAFLAKYLKKDGRGINRLAYSRVSTADKQALKAYLTVLQSTDVTTLNRNEQYAFWLNLYNSSTVNIGLKHYPIKSILDVKSNVLDLKGPFNDKVATVMGLSLTLDNIESGIVRPIWKDPRLHYAFNCAAISCPNLGAKARVENGKVTASKIYFWYDVDFGGNATGVLKHINQYAGPELKAALGNKRSIAKYEYDWALNEAR